MPAGLTGWLPAQQHAGENIGDTDTHVLFVELKDSASRRPGAGSAVTPAGDLPRSIGAPATRALTPPATRPGSLAGVPERELGPLHGVGPKALRILREALEEQGLPGSDPVAARSPG